MGSLSKVLFMGMQSFESTREQSFVQGMLVSTSVPCIHPNHGARVTLQCLCVCSSCDAQIFKAVVCNESEWFNKNTFILHPPTAECEQAKQVSSSSSLNVHVLAT